MNLSELKPIVEALVFASDAPVTLERIQETLEDTDAAVIEQVVEELNREYAESGRSFFIRKVGGGYHISTKPEFHSWIKKLFFGRQKYRLTQASMETLAIIAFKQPISRVDIAQIRGVNSDAVVGTLMERKLVTIAGRSEGVGRPLLYGTTPEFLKYFGINDLSELPKPREIEELFSKEGLPDEVAQLLAESDKQLSLPINFEGEAAKEGDVTEVSIAEIAASTGAALAAPQLLQRAPVDGQSAQALNTEDEDVTPQQASAVTSLEDEASAAPEQVSANAAAAVEESSKPPAKDLIDALPDTLPGTTESEEGIGFYGLFADTPEVSEKSQERDQPPQLEFDSKDDMEELEALTRLTEDEPEALLQPRADEEKPNFAMDTMELAAMEFNIREPELPIADPINQAADSLPERFLTEDLGTTREFALLDGRLSEEEQAQIETPIQELPANLETTNEILLATLVSLNEEKENNPVNESGSFDFKEFLSSPAEELEPEPPALEIDGWVAEETFNGESQAAQTEARKPEEGSLDSAEEDSAASSESELARVFAERDHLAAETTSPQELPPARETEIEAPEFENFVPEAEADDRTAVNTTTLPAGALEQQDDENEEENSQRTPGFVPVAAMSLLDTPERPESQTPAESSFGSQDEEILRADAQDGSVPARIENEQRPESSAIMREAEPPRDEDMNAAREEHAPESTAEPPFFVPAPAQIGASETMISSPEVEAASGIIRLWRRAMNWFKSALQKLSLRA